MNDRPTRQPVPTTAPDEAARLAGNIETLVQARGFGFISSGPPDHVQYFFHQSALPDRRDFEGLKVGTPVTFVVDPTSKSSAKGLRAEQVRINTGRTGRR